MAAPAQVAKGFIRKARPLAVKTSLNSPFSVKWSALQGDDMHFILQTLQEKFTQSGFKIETSNRRRKRNSTQRENKHKKCKTTKELASQEVRQDADGKHKNPENAEVKQGWTDSVLRKELAIGVNEVTRALEKNELNLVLVCKSVRPALITMHLIELSVSRAVPACQVPRLSENIAPVLGLKSVLALGFRKTTEAFVSEVKAITARVPPLHVPWLQCTFEQGLLASEQDETQEGQEVEAMETSTTETPLTLKHKRKRSYLALDGKTTSSRFTLQALRVKKLVPNPNKVRKVKKAKKSSSK